MKRFRINIDGKSYDVEVEELGGTQELPKVSVVPAPIAESLKESAAPAPIAELPKATDKVTAEEELITAPMPGRIMSINVKVGQMVTAGEQVLTLEAMKMENHVFCESSGTVREVRANEGATVNPGDVLVVIH